MHRRSPFALALYTGHRSRLLHSYTALSTNAILQDLQISFPDKFAVTTIERLIVVRTSAVKRAPA